MNRKHWLSLALAVAATIAAPPVAAQGGGVLSNKIELEKRVAGADGAPDTISYTAPETVVPGDRVRVTLIFTNNGAAPATGVNLVNPVPDALLFDGADESPGFAVSVDGGKTFGALGSLRVPGPNAESRAASSADVTHVRWLWLDAVPVGESRTVAFFGRVR